MPTLSIVVPCYNEEKNIPIILDRFEKCLYKNDFEVILVNDGSKDNSSSVFKSEMEKRNHSQIRVVEYEKNKGYGGAILTGLDEAKGDILCWTHADAQTDPMDVERALEKYLKAKDPEKIFLKGERVGRSFSQWFFTLGMSFFSTLVLRKKLGDVNAQPKMFPRSFFEKVRPHAPSDFSLDLYFLYLAKKFKFEIQTIPVLFLDRIHGESAWAFSFSSKWKTVLRTMKYIFGLPRLVKKVK